MSSLNKPFEVCLVLIELYIYFLVSITALLLNIKYSKINTYNISEFQQGSKFFFIVA